MNSSKDLIRNYRKSASRASSKNFFIETPLLKKILKSPCMNFWKKSLEKLCEPSLEETLEK